MTATTAADATAARRPFWRNWPNWRNLWRNETLWAFVAALVLGLVYGRVGVANLTTGLVGGNSNGYENYWNDWWFREALGAGRNPFSTNAIFAPNGVSLRFHTLNPLGALVALPLAPLVGAVGAMNLKFLAALVGAVFFAWLAFRDATGSGAAAFAGAGVYALASDQTAYYWIGGAENYLMGAALLPLYVWLLLRAATRPRWLPWAAGAAGALLALCLTDWQYTMFAVVVTLVYFACVLPLRRPLREKAGTFLRLATVGGLWLVVVAVPLLLPMLREARESPWLAASGQAVQLSRSLAQLFVPGAGNPGLVALIVGAVGLALWWRRSRLPDAPERGERFAVAFWAAVAAVGTVASLGPYLKLAPGDSATDIPLPYAALYQLPVLSVGRRPQLWHYIALLGCGALLAFAVRELARWLQRRLAARRGGGLARFAASPALPLALVVAVLAPTLAPFVAGAGTARAFPLDVPPFYRDVLARDRAPYAILELPPFAESGRGTNWPALQTVHGKRIFDGSISRDHGLESPTIFVKQATFFRDAFWMAKPQQRELLRPARTPDMLPMPAYAEIGVPLLRHYDVRYVVLWFAALRDLRPDGVEFADSLVRQAIGGEVRPAYEDAIMRVYRVPDVTPMPVASPLFLDVGATGWYPAERTPDGVGYRWAGYGSPAEILAFNVSPERGRATIRFALFNYRAPRTVDIAINGYPAGSYALAGGESRNVVLELDIPPGMNKLTLASTEPPIPVEAAPGTRDNRRISFGVRGLTMKPMP